MCLSRLRYPLKTFAADERGAMTVEFIIWLPLILGWFVISATAYNAFSARADAGNAAFALADVMSRQVTVDEDFVDDLSVLHASLLPGRTERTLRVSSIVWSEAASRAFVIWSSNRGSVPPLNNGSLDDVRLPLMADGETIILVETGVPHSFLSDWIGSETTVWRHALPVRPRYVGAVANTDVTATAATAVTASSTSSMTAAAAEAPAF